MQMSVLETSNAIPDVTLTFVALLLNSTTQVRRTRESQTCLIFSFRLARMISHQNFAAREMKRLGNLSPEAFCSTVSSRVRWAKDCSKPEPG